MFFPYNSAKNVRISMQSYLVGFHPLLQKINIFDQKDTEAATVGVL